MPPPSLLQLCTSTAIRNVKYLNDIGNVPYSLARPFLLKIESPEKLRSLELLSPHIMEEDTELWLDFIKRDIPRWDEYDLPEQPHCWYDVYCDLQQRVQKAVEEDAEKLKMALDGINSERAKHSAKFVTDRRIIPLPRERPTAKQRYASYDRKMGGLTPRFTSPRGGMGSSDPLGAPVWSYERPQLPRPEKKKSNIFNLTKRNPVLAVPTKQLNNRASQVKKAPLSLIEEHRRPPEPVVPRRNGPPTLVAPGRSRLQSTRSSGGSCNLVDSASLREREARLRALTSGKQSGSSTPKSSENSPAPATAPYRTSATPASKSLQAPFSSSTAQGSAKSSLLEAIPDPDNSGVPPAQPPRTVMRKRPAPSLFIQPRKKKVN
ncbi:elongin A domain-containing protein [Aspergillus novofumigatus IBT 16806]|uniref:Putative RNA polymerase II transcription factor SIII subunit A n=1 Tax=Aspergillus novofumigatus (strain IBT 16806) TaxID=1392255 RepID=A0A2I1CLY7_ASPN1|nr:putative RNA polymerase II transcription factor SIII subunit A [Aspergillus novofumigatus IBT 16806]PKX98647.1 putative RNA polymerase II transcription factor SIII subunit A [Aspergillus novofumigatus IBT 16806]